MPKYSYHCQECQTTFDYLILTKEDSPSCPKCHSENLKKIPAVFGTISDDTRFETAASDLPSIKEFSQKKNTPPKKLDRKEIFKDF